MYTEKSMVNENGDHIHIYNSMDVNMPSYRMKILAIFNMTLSSSRLWPCHSNVKSDRITFPAARNSQMICKWGNRILVTWASLNFYIELNVTNNSDKLHDLDRGPGLTDLKSFHLTRREKMLHKLISA